MLVCIPDTQQRSLYTIVGGMTKAGNEDKDTAPSVDTHVAKPFSSQHGKNAPSL